MMKPILYFLSLLINLALLADQTHAEMAVFTNRGEFVDALKPNSLIEDVDRLWDNLAPVGGRLTISDTDGSPDNELVEPGSFVLSSELGGSGNRGAWLAVDSEFPGNSDQISVDGTDYSFVLLMAQPARQRNFIVDFTPSGQGRYAFSMDYTIPRNVGDNVMRVVTDEGDQGTVQLSRNPGEFVGFIFDHDALRVTLECVNVLSFISLNMDNVDFFVQDECPDDPDKNKPGECGCGVAEVDSDNNGVLDCKEEEDECPDDPDKNKPGECGCGIADVDSDNNGVMDCKEEEDECPDDPDKDQPGECGCGIADVDSDNNGILDCKEVDECPDDPDKDEPGECGCGIADVDSDNNGVLDCKEEEEVDQLCSRLFQLTCK